MALTPGTRIGPYEILSAIGAGGMGEVYRARDPKLNRNVAIKILLPAVASDPDRLVRFGREAQVLAALNHPNIAHIYGIEESNGSRALVMELVEGPTLADRIAQGPIPFDEALPIARQIAEALEVAHEQGIIHRDLKPANIKVRSDGIVKVLDFGLAKAAATDSTNVAADPMNSPTITSPAMMTGTGMILGTAAYMSPEQAKGKSVDKRTDVWAFGCVLYEMLTGRRAFQGDDVADTLAAVIRGEPEWSVLAEPVTGAVRTVLARCLQKDPRQRMRDMGDVLLALDGAFEPALAMPAPSHAGTLTGVTISSLVVAFLIAGWAYWRSDDRVPRVVTRSEIGLANLGGLFGRSFTLSPDGLALVYVENTSTGSRLMRRDLARLTAEPIAGTDGVSTGPFFSPDGGSIGFVASGGLGRYIKTVPSSGGAVVTAAELPPLGGPISAAWGADGNIAFGSENGLWRVPATGGSPKQLIQTPRAVGGPQILAGGDVILFHVTTGDGEGSIEVLRVSTGERKVVAAGTDARYAEAGHLVFARKDGTIWAVRFDLDGLKPIGEAVALGATALRRIAENPAQFTLTSNGTLAYLPAQANGGERLMWVDREGAPTLAFPESAAYAYPRLTPDGKRVAVSIATDIWIVDLERSVRNKLTFGDRRGSTSALPAGILAWTHDGDRITFNRGRRETPQSAGTTIEWTKVDGGDPETLLRSDELIVPVSWSRDGELAYQRRTGGNRDLWVFRPGPGGSDKAFVSTPAQERAPMFSPDGRWLAYVSNESGVDEVYVRPYPSSGGRFTVSSNGGVEPLWSRDGTELFYRQGDAMMATTVRRGKPLSLGVPRPVFQGGAYLRDTSGAAAVADYDVAADGRFLMIAPPARDQSVVLVLNWFEELKRLVPTN